MKKTLAFVLLLLTGSAASHAASPLRIQCVGDSITQGGKTNQAEYTYRLPLQQKLRTAGIAFDFVGSQKSGLQGDATWPDIAPGVPFDLDHDGYYGHKTADALQKTIKGWKADAPPPDVVMIHLGTNDQGAEDHVATVQTPLRDFIAFLRTKNPSVIVLLGHLNFNGSKGADSIRSLVETLAREVNTATSPVITVPHYQGWVENPDSPGTDTFDWAHPNPQGQEKMAARWLAALQPHLKH